MEALRFIVRRRSPKTALYANRHERRRCVGKAAGTRRGSTKSILDGFARPAPTSIAPPGHWHDHQLTDYGCAPVYEIPGRGAMVNRGDQASCRVGSRQGIRTHPPWIEERATELKVAGPARSRALSGSRDHGDASGVDPARSRRGDAKNAATWRVHAPMMAMSPSARTVRGSVKTVCGRTPRLQGKSTSNPETQARPRPSARAAQPRGELPVPDPARRARARARGEHEVARPREAEGCARTTRDTGREQQAGRASRRRREDRAEIGRVHAVPARYAARQLAIRVVRDSRRRSADRRCG